MTCTGELAAAGTVGSSERITMVRQVFMTT
jgi:hypothetical protein